MMARENESPFARRIPARYKSSENERVNYFFKRVRSSQRKVKETPVESQISAPIKLLPQRESRKSCETGRDPDPVLNNLVNIVNEMKGMFKAPPERKASKSYELRKKKNTHRPYSKAISLRHKNPNERAHSYRTNVPRKQTRPNIGAIQRFFFEFHNKSKILLSQLEKNVLQP